MRRALQVNPSVGRASRFLQLPDHVDPSTGAYRRGRAAMEAGNFAVATKWLAVSAKLSPHFKTWEVLGESLLQQGRINEAIVPLAAATLLNKQGRAPSLLAKALLKQGDEVKAHEMARLALERAPGNRLATSIRASTKEAYDRWVKDNWPNEPDERTP